MGKNCAYIFDIHTKAWVLLLRVDLIFVQYHQSVKRVPYTMSCTRGFYTRDLTVEYENL